VQLEASTKPHAHKKIHEFFINMALTMVCPNFRKDLKMASGSLGVKDAPSLGFKTPLLYTLILS
jgi:hypothetical protein